MCIKLKILYKIKKKNYKLSQNLNIFLSNKNGLIYIKGLFGILVLKLASYYFYLEKTKLISILFITKKIFINFLKIFFVIYKKLFYIYWICLKIKGLGFRIRRITNNFYYFFFNFTNMFYLNIPKNIIVKWYKKRLILVSNDFSTLKIILATIIILKKLGPYQLRGIKYPRQIILFKKKKKSF